MSVAESHWPGWLRRHSRVERLPPPPVFFAWLAIGLALVTLVFVGAWNAQRYPVPLGYDAQPNVDYAHVVLHDHRLPTATESGESNQPPAYYVLAGLAAEAGHNLFGWHESDPYTQLPDKSYRGAQYLNVLLALLTALCILWIARVIAPTRPWVWAASVGFFAFLPVVSKTVAMFHPENLNMFASTAAIALTTQMTVRQTFRRRYVMLLALTLALALVSRASALFTVLAVLVGFGSALRQPALRAQVPWRRVGVASAAVLVLLVPWVVYRGVVHHSGPLNRTSALLDAALHPRSVNLTDSATSRARFWDLPVDQMLNTPWRSNYKNAALAETYTEIWGDWIGVFSWSAYSIAPTADAQKVLRDQNAIGIAPTLLAIAGWLALVYLSLRRRPALAALAVMPIVAISGYLYRSYLILSHDGDLFKATYILNTVPAWAIGFGLATGWLGQRSRLTRYAMVCLFAFFAILELRFMMYGIRDHRPIF